MTNCTFWLCVFLPPLFRLWLRTLFLYYPALHVTPLVVIIIREGRREIWRKDDGIDLGLSRQRNKSKKGILLLFAFGYSSREDIKIAITDDDRSFYWLLECIRIRDSKRSN